jgi:serine/threonine protein kinase
MELVEGRFREYAQDRSLARNIEAIGAGRVGLARRRLHGPQPSNVLVTSQGHRILWIDHGHWADAPSNEPIAGTPVYMSPEQATGLPLSKQYWYSAGIMLPKPSPASRLRGTIEPRPPLELAPGCLASGSFAPLLEYDPRMRLFRRPDARVLLGITAADITVVWEGSLCRQKNHPAP